MLLGLGGLAAHGAFVRFGLCWMGGWVGEWAQLWVHGFVAGSAGCLHGGGHGGLGDGSGFSGCQVRDADNVRTDRSIPHIYILSLPSSPPSPRNPSCIGRYFAILEAQVGGRPLMHGDIGRACLNPIGEICLSESLASYLTANLPFLSQVCILSHCGSGV